MKGPGLRNDLDIRRSWQCPQCGRLAKQLGDVVAMVCSCVDPPVQMKILPEVKPRVFQFAKIEIPLCDEDLQIRDRPRRMPPPVNPDEVVDRRPQRPKRPKPERKSFDEFVQEGIAETEGQQRSDNDSFNDEPASEIAAPAPPPDRIQKQVDVGNSEVRKKSDFAKIKESDGDDFGEGL